MKQYVSVLIEHTTLKLNQPFTYVYDSAFPLKVGCRVWVDFNHQSLIGFVLAISSKAPLTNYVILPIQRVIDEKPLITDELLNLAKQYSSDHYLSQIALLQAMLPPSLKPRKSSLSSPKIKYETWICVTDKVPSELTPKLHEMYHLIKQEKELKLATIKQKKTVAALIDIGLLQRYQKEVFRYQVHRETAVDAPVFTLEQTQAFNNLLNTNKTISLLQGVTGSGKTELYIALAKEALHRDRSTLMIVPEIALTSMMVAYFGKHFSDQVAVLHSELTPAERYDEYRKIYQGLAKVVIGARSAIFAPLSNIGYIIIDEEHSESYKQDVPPYYHVLDIAQMRAKYHQAKIILGSATPSLESKARAMKGVYGWVEMTQRIHQTNPPKTYIVDMKDNRNISSVSFMFSNQLIAAMKETLRKQEQIILLLNKRGYAQSLVCRGCGDVVKCPSCHLPLNVHVQSANLKCHYCNHVESMPQQCRECKGRYFNRLGFGTQRVEEEIRKIFPQESIIRLDADTTQLRQSVSRLLEAFKKHDASILIGTQMVAKGHDFPNVTLVGVVSADIGLTIPSYRSNERTFQLLSQAIGRTGRGEKEGMAIIQTFNPQHDVIQFAKTQDYEKFFQFEMRQRKLGFYPPYRFLVTVELTSSQLDVLVLSAEAVRTMLLKYVSDQDILGPLTPFIEKKGPYYLRQMVIKYKDATNLKVPFEEILTLFKTKSLVKLTINFNPLDL